MRDVLFDHGREFSGERMLGTWRIEVKVFVDGRIRELGSDSARGARRVVPDGKDENDPTAVGCNIDGGGI
jgi:hypothetical protein